MKVAWGLVPAFLFLYHQLKDKSYLLYRSIVPYTERLLLDLWLEIIREMFYLSMLSIDFCQLQQDSDQIFDHRKYDSPFGFIVYIIKYGTSIFKELNFPSAKKSTY